MTVPLVDLKAQYRGIKTEIDAAVQRVFENTSFCLGPEVDTFEGHFAEFCETRYAIGVSSGTDALQLALMACGVGPGDEVITTPFTFIATAAAISHVGATPVFVDIDARSYNINPALIEQAITPRTKAILPVHLYGQPVDMDPIIEISHDHGIKVIEDACQAVGARYKGKRVGGLADVACFSFYCSKNLGAAGDGGIVTTDNGDIAEMIFSLRDHGRTSHYGHSRIGFTYRLDALQAAILDVKLQRLDAWNAKRRQHAALFDQLLEPLSVVTPVEPEGYEGVHHLYVVRAANRDQLVHDLRSRGIGAGIHYPIAVHQQPAYAALHIPDGTFPVSEEAAGAVLSLPIYPEMTSAQVHEVVDAVRDCLS